MKFFENSFFVTTYSAPHQRSVHPEVILAKTMDDLIECYQTSTPPDGQSVRLLIGVVLDHARQQPFAEITRHNAQQLLTQCLMAFNCCSLEEQIIIVSNLNQLALAALRKKQYKECLFLTRALIFCCLSAHTPTVEFHETLLRAIFLFSTARDVRDVQIILPYLDDMAAKYVKGLPEPERVLLNRNNPALMRRIMGEASTQTIFNSTSTSNLMEAPTSSTSEEQTILGRLNK